MGRVARYRGRTDIAAVLAMLANRMTGDEVRRARRALSRAVRGLWPPEAIRRAD